MYINKNKLFTIGQFSAIHGVTKKTLMWYDEINLLKPDVIGENGYRYYTYAQSTTLETILMLRELNVSIKEIQEFMCNLSANNMEQLLREKIKEVEHSITKLKNIRQILVSRRQDMMNLLHIDLSEISIVEKKRCYLATIPITEENKESEISDREIENVIQETKKHKVHRLHDSTYGAMISIKNLYQNNFNKYYALYIEIPYPLSKKGLHLQPAGKYLRAFCKGDWSKLSNRYKEILDYAEKHGLSLIGYSYEIGINETVIDNINDYITQIEIPIKINDKKEIQSMYLS